jgi:apolipoprotein N-acyltransferase
LAGGAGLVAYLAFKPEGWWFLAPVALAGLYATLAGVGLGLTALGGLAFGLGLFLPMLTWAFNAAGALPYLALALVSALLLALGPVVWRLARPLVERGFAGRPWVDAVCFALAYTAADTLRSFVPFGGFPWGRLGFSQAAGPLALWARLGGTPLVGLGAALMGTLAVAAARSASGRRAKAALGAGLAVAGLALAPLAHPLVFPKAAAAEAGELRVGAVQGDVEVTAEGLFARQREVLDNHVAGTLALMANQEGRPLDIVLWPENSTDIDPRTDQEAGAAIDRAATAAAAPVLVGAMEYVPGGRRYNQGLVWRAGLGVVAQYSKQHPAPFAEYMPARSFFRLFTKKVDLITTDMLAGDRVGALALEAGVLGRTVTLGDIICFEVAYDSLVAETVRGGAEALVVQTNNASFGFSEESVQQLAMTRLRAIEHGRAAVQVSTVGVSAAFAPDGAYLAGPTKLFEPASFAVDLPLRSSLTPASVVGDWVAWAIMLLAAAWAVAGQGARLAGGRD